jgi:hypothetical protein
LCASLHHSPRDFRHTIFPCHSILPTNIHPRSMFTHTPTLYNVLGQPSIMVNPHPLPQSHLPQSNTEIVLVILHHKKHLFITQRRLELHSSLCHSPKSFWHIASFRKINPCSPILLPFTMILVNPLSWTPLPSSCHMFYSTHIRNTKQEMHTNNVAIKEGFEVEFYKHGIHPLVHHIVDLFNHVVRIGF